MTEDPRMKTLSKGRRASLRGGMWELAGLQADREEDEKQCSDESLSFYRRNKYHRRGGRKWWEVHDDSLRLRTGQLA